MDLTNTFNAAAGGPQSDPIAAEATGPQDLGGGGAMAEPIGEENDVSTPTSTNAFAEAVEPANEPYAEPPLSLEDAAAELAELESGRPKPTPQDDFKPDPKLVQIVHTKIEQDRENRISALNAYLEFAQPEPENVAEHDHDESPEPAF